jgi:hypothetical protein
MRTDYVEGCGQLCHSCAVKMNTQQHLLHEKRVPSLKWNMTPSSPTQEA